MGVTTIFKQVGSIIFFTFNIVSLKPITKRPKKLSQVLHQLTLPRLKNG